MLPVPCWSPQAVPRFQCRSEAWLAAQLWLGGESHRTRSPGFGRTRTPERLLWSLRVLLPAAVAVPGTPHLRRLVCSALGSQEALGSVHAALPVCAARGALPWDSPFPFGAIP